MVPVLHTRSHTAVASVIKNPPQSLLISGAVGVGTRTVADYIATSMNGTIIHVLPEKDEKIDIEKGTITVSIIRRLYIQTRTIQPKSLVIIIDYAERMAPPAQNAFLKLLEEPNNNIYFILVSHTPELLLPTVTSRTRHLELLLISNQQTQAFLDTHSITDSVKRTQLVYMAQGLPAELARLLSDTKYFDMRALRLRDARTLLQSSTYDKLKVIHAYKDAREGALSLIDDALLIIEHTLQSSPTSDTLSLIHDLLQTRKRIAANGNIRLCLTRLVI